MATTSTTLVGAIGVDTPQIQLANKAALRAGDTINIGGTTGEAMRCLVTDPAAGVPIVVYRGSEGTAGKTAASGATVTYGPAQDFTPGVTPMMVRTASRPELDPFLAEIKAERDAKQDEADVKDAEGRAKKAADEQTAAAEKAAKAAADADRAAAKADADADRAAAKADNRR